MRHPILLTSLLVLSGCYRFMAIIHDTAEPEDAEQTTAAVKRSHDNPNVEMTAAEKKDIEAICSAVVYHDRKGTPRGEDIKQYPITPGSKWGTELVTHINAEGRHAVGPRLARLLRDMDMKWSSADCRMVVKTYSNFN